MKAFIPLALSFIFLSTPAFALSEKEKLDQLTPEARKVFTAFLKEARKQFPNHNIIVAETYRTQARQDKLYKKGRHVTTVKISNHTRRIAADIYFVKNKRILAYEKAPYWKLGLLGESLGLRCGMRWKIPFDPGHYELREQKK